MVNIEEVKRGVVNFIDAELGRKATGFNKFSVYFMMPIIDKKIEAYVNQFRNNEMTKDFFDANGNIDIDMLYNYSKQAIQKSGQFIIFGIVINETDLDKLYKYIKGEIV